MSPPRLGTPHFCRMPRCLFRKDCWRLLLCLMNNPDGREGHSECGINETPFAGLDLKGSATPTRRVTKPRATGRVAAQCG